MALYHGWSGPATPVELNVGPESFETRIRPAIDWSQTPSGTYRGYDDGSVRDTYECTIRVRLDPSEAITFADTFLGSSVGYDTTLTYWAPALCRPFGPSVDCTGGVLVGVLGVEVIGQVDSVCPLWDYAITMRLLSKPTPSGGSVTYLLAHGRAFPETDNPSIRKPAEGGRTAQSARPGGPTSCMWSCGGLTTDEASDIQNYLAGTWRNATQSWTEPGGLKPFGPDRTGPFDIYCIDYTWTLEGLQAWRIEARFSL